MIYRADYSSFSAPEDSFDSVSGTVGDWELIRGDGPVIATAIHDGHHIRDSLLPFLAIGDADRRREEDPLTAMLLSAGDTKLRMLSSRFEFDVNRAREHAISDDPADTWDLRIWNTLPAPEVGRSLSRYDEFYRMIESVLHAHLDQWGCALLLDIHSYNHRREGPAAAPAAQQSNPDIDLGVTTLDMTRWGDSVRRFEAVLSGSTVGGRLPDVRRNVRYAGGGHFPEWVYTRFGTDVCTISLEYKKIFMDEWSGTADIAAIEDLRAGLERAVSAVRGDFVACR